MELVIKENNWGRNPQELTSPQELRDVVLKPAYDVLVNAFGKNPDKPIHIYRRGDGPRVLYHRRPYEILLNPDMNYMWYPQCVYQYVHELCHVMIGYDRCKEHKHLWFEESVCELASLFVLKNRTQEYQDYACRVVKDYNLPILTNGQLPQWLSENRETMERGVVGGMLICQDIRRLNAVVANALLPAFLKEPSLWGDCSLMNHQETGADAEFSDYLDSWTVRLQKAGREDRVPSLVRKTFGIP